MPESTDTHTPTGGGLVAEEGTVVTLLTITTRFGDDHMICRTPAVAHDALIGYVTSNWRDEMGEEQMPDDDDDAIEQYFERMEIKGEYYSISPDLPVQ